MNMAEYFRNLRFDERHHLGLGDIRLTLGQQEEIVEAIAAQAAATLPATPFPREQLVGAIARAWCHKPNEHKPMDSDLVTAIELEIVDLVDHYAKGNSDAPKEGE